MATKAQTEGVVRVAMPRKSFIDIQLATEHTRSRAYAIRRASRISKSLTDDDTLRKARIAERRYSVMHQRERWRRLRAARNLDAIRAISPLGGMWMLGPTKTHTPTCFGMAGKCWPWSVLEEINPAKEHPGCACWIASAPPGMKHGSMSDARKAIAEVTTEQRREKARTAGMASSHHDLMAQTRSALAKDARMPWDINELLDETRRRLAAGMPDSLAEAAWRPHLHPRHLKGGPMGGRFKRASDATAPGAPHEKSLVPSATRGSAGHSTDISKIKPGTHFARSRSVKSEHMELIKANLKAHGVDVPKNASLADAVALVDSTREKLLAGETNKAKARLIRKDLNPEMIATQAQLVFEATNELAGIAEEMFSPHLSPVPEWRDMEPETRAALMERYASFYPEYRKMFKDAAQELRQGGHNAPPWQQIVYAAAAMSPNKDWDGKADRPTLAAIRMAADSIPGLSDAPDKEDTWRYKNMKSEIRKAFAGFKGQTWEDIVKSNDREKMKRWEAGELKAKPTMLADSFTDIERDAHGANARKTRSFALNLLGDESKVTVDLHMYAAAFPGHNNHGKGGHGREDLRYEAISISVTRLAEQMDVSPATAQALLWGYIREYRYDVGKKRAYRAKGAGMGKPKITDAERARNRRVKRETMERRKEMSSRNRSAVESGASASEKAVREVMREIARKVR